MRLVHFPLLKQAVLLCSSTLSRNQQNLHGGHVLCCCGRPFRSCSEQLAPHIEASRASLRASLQLSQQYAIALGQLFSHHDNRTQ